MIPRARPIALLVAALATVLAPLAAGCGSEDKGAQIPATNAQQLTTLLDQVDRRIKARNACGDIREQDFPALERQLNELPSDLDSNARETLEEGIAHLRDLIDEECGQIQEERQRTTETETTPTVEPPPPETETQTTETEPPTEPPTIPEPPTDGGGGQEAPDSGGGGVGPNGDGDDD